MCIGSFVEDDGRVDSVLDSYSRDGRSSLGYGREMFSLVLHSSIGTATFFSVKPPSACRYHSAHSVFAILSLTSLGTLFPSLAAVARHIGLYMTSSRPVTTNTVIMVYSSHVKHVIGAFDSCIIFGLQRHFYVSVIAVLI